jgi:lysophospholipase L1-like esterase
MNTFRSGLLAASCVACVGSACAQPATDLVVLPAPASAWRITAGHWERQAELVGDSVVAPRPNAEYARESFVAATARNDGSGLRESVLFDWKDLWQSTLRFESRQPLDLRPYLSGSLEFDVDVAELAKGGVKVKLACGDGCERSVRLRPSATRGWQHVTLAMSCFVRDGANFSKINLPFSLEGTGTGRVSLANVRISRAAKASGECPDYRNESVTPATLDESWAIEWWLPRHEQKLEEKRRLLAAGTGPEIVFIGDSITQGWEKEGREVWQQHYAAHHALDLGFGGDRTENVLWRLQHGEVDGIAPKVAVLMVGTNNSGHRAENPQTTAAGIQRLVEELRQRLPRTKVLLLAIFPRGATPDDFLRGLNERVNKIIAGQADGSMVHFLDINHELLERDGTLDKAVMPDLLHPNAKGYAIWQRAMDPTLQRLLKQP